jgi:hypothetical protein
LPATLKARHSHSTSTSLALHGSTPYYVPPEISLTLNGPMELFFPHATTELVVKTPRYLIRNSSSNYLLFLYLLPKFPIDYYVNTYFTKRFVDVGYVERIILREGANITLIGSAELRLRDSIAITPTISLEDNRLVINTKDTPKLNVYGHRIEIKNNEGEELKAKKKFASVLEISPAKDTSVRESRLPFELPLNDSRIATIQVHTLFL